MEGMYGLTPKGYLMARSTSVVDQNDPDWTKWQIIRELKTAHYASKEKLIARRNLSPAMCSLAIANLKQHGYIYDSSQTQPMGV
jgi:hypothetical protein